MPKLLTIIICTYNRNEILAQCLNSFQSQDAHSSTYDLLVVNNYANEAIPAEILDLVQSLPNARLVTEPTAGLSYARNKGMNEANTEWVGYIDDDCLIPSDFVSTALEVIHSEGHKCFGGHIDSWWLEPRPRWLSPDYGTKPRLADVSTALPHDDYIWGGNMFFEKNTLMEVNGFDEKVGMSADRIGYSAENRVQINLRQLGVEVWYIPDLTVEHLVAPHKYSLYWHLRAAYAEGRDGRVVFPEQYTSSYLFMELMRLPKSVLISVYKWVTQSSYYWENAVLSVGKPVWRLLGKVQSK